MKNFRFIRSPAASASYNMSMDEAIFNRYLKDGVPVLRIYRWQAPSFTYGFSQSLDSELDLKSCASYGIEVVKRMTGGGILLHHDEITYSFVCNKEDVGEPGGVFVSYREICAFLIRFYRSLGLEAGFALESHVFKDRCAPHALCSASHERYDIVINGKKIGGNAQKRKRQVIFQHGSIPRSIDWALMRRCLRSVPEGMESAVTALSAELASVPQEDALEGMLISAFSETFDVKFIFEDEPLLEASVA